MRFYIFFIYIVLCPFLLNAQNRRLNNETESKNLKSLVIIGLTKNRTIEVEFENRIEVPDGFGEVNIFNNVLKPLDANVLGEVKSETFSEKEINALLNNNKIGQQILSYWFARQADGTFNIDSIEKRKLLNTLEINLLTEPSKKRMSLRIFKQWMNIMMRAKPKMNIVFWKVLFQLIIII